MNSQLEDLAAEGKCSKFKTPLFLVNNGLVINAGCIHISFTFKTLYCSVSKDFWSTHKLTKTIRYEISCLSDALDDIFKDLKELKHEMKELSK